MEHSQRKSKARHAIIVAGYIILVWIVFIMAVLLNTTNKSKTTTGNKQITIIIEYSNVTYEYSINTNRTYMAELLTDLNSTHEFGAVVKDGMLTTLLGRESDLSFEYYAIYIVYPNGSERDYALYGVAELEIHDGETYIFTLTNYLSNTVMDGPLMQENSIIPLIILATCLSVFPLLIYYFATRWFLKTHAFKKHALALDEKEDSSQQSSDLLQTDDSDE